METRATVVIPTFGDAKFARWAVKSVQNQTVRDIEICIICDGSPENMISFFHGMGKEDQRIKVFTYPKAPRTGEPYRDIVIKQTTGKIICYCSHDDLWLPDHIRAVEKSLATCCFTHTLHASIGLPKEIKGKYDIFSVIYDIDLTDINIVKTMLSGTNFFGLTFGAHTRASYMKLSEGWITTPRPEIPTDLYMWCKFLNAYGNNCKTTSKLTALNFPKIMRDNWSETERDDELRFYYERIQSRPFLWNLKMYMKINQIINRKRKKSLSVL
ncbi:MAG: glycosyltransferase family A protein [Smithellaceae bacterium]